jgi:hypothetical protein
VIEPILRLYQDTVRIFGLLEFVIAPADGPFDIGHHVVATVTWIVDPTTVGCLVAALMRSGLGAPSMGASIVAAARHEDVFILAVSCCPRWWARC